MSTLTAGDALWLHVSVLCILCCLALCKNVADQKPDHFKAVFIFLAVYVLYYCNTVGRT